MNTRNRTPSEYIGYGLYLYFSGLSLRRVSERLSFFIKRNHVTIWNWIQKYKPQMVKAKQRRITKFIVDETLIKVGSELTWIWVAIEPQNRQILALSISKEREKHADSRRKVSLGFGQKSRKTSHINGWRYMVPDGL